LSFIGIFVCSCQTAQAQKADPSTKPLAQQPSSANEASVKEEGFSFTLHDVSPANGTIARLTAHSPSQPVGHFGKTEIPFYPAPELGADAYEAVFGIPYDQKPGEAEIEVSGGDNKNPKKLVLKFRVVDGNYPSEKLTVDPKHVNPPKKAMAQIAADLKKIGKAYASSKNIKLWSGAFILPIESAMTSPFGTRRLYNGEPRSFHPGLDLRAAVGTPIHAAAAARVAFAGELYFTGNTVILDHGFGVFTLYAHMSKLQVKNDDVVKRGQVLGLSGKTGRVSGPHLHWGALIRGVKVNPHDLTQVMR
jgi:murein DD-endopeptidase MepM/ murein hydrolase activator NlpD